MQRMLGPKQDGTTGDGENYKMRNFLICTFYLRT